MIFNLTDHIAEQSPCAMTLQRAIDAKEKVLFVADPILRSLMPFCPPATQRKLWDQVFPGLQAINANLVALRTLREAELCKLQVRKDEMRGMAA